MALTDTFKVLSNEYRLQMLLWTKEPHKHFVGADFTDEAIDPEGGVCVQAITIKSGLAQSVVSGYLNALKQAGLLTTYRSGKWTYYRYNAQAVDEFIQQLHQTL